MGNLKLPRINRVCLAGRLTRDPENKYIPSGTQCFEFNIAVHTGFGDREETSFFHVTAWAKQAERAEKQGLVKGSPVYVEGELKQERWKDRDGKKQSKTRITAWQVERLDWPDDGQQSAPSAAPPETQGSSYVGEDDDIPW